MAEIKTKTIFDLLTDISFTKIPWKDQEQKKLGTFFYVDDN